MVILKVCFIYGMSLAAGAAIATRIALGSLLAGILITFTWSAIQILLAVQVLSLFHRLEGNYLLVWSAASTLLTFAISQPFRPALLKAWAVDCSSVGACLSRQSPTARCMLALAIGSALVLAALQGRLLPAGDSYHFSMPLYWKEHGSILPFPVSNPRITGLTFSSEAYCFPAVLFLKSWISYAALATFAKILVVFLVIETALRLRLSVDASVCAGAIVVAYPPMMGIQPDLQLASMWFAGAIFLLLLARARPNKLNWCLGASVVCFFMACGAKNVVPYKDPSTQDFFFGSLEVARSRGAAFGLFLLRVWLGSFAQRRFGHTSATGSGMATRGGRNFSERRSLQILVRQPSGPEPCGPLLTRSPIPVGCLGLCKILMLVFEKAPSAC